MTSVVEHGNSKWLLFDLGGVLVDFSGIRDLPPLLRKSRSETELREEWLLCPVVRAFEVAELSADEFSQRFVREWDLLVSPEVFLSEFRSWTRGFYPGARELLGGLASRNQLACLSNSNEAHWERNGEELGIFEPFEMALSSHILGFHKPDPEIYVATLKKLEAEPGQVVFFDDIAANVEAAQRLGIVAHQVSGIGELRARIRELGLSAT